jgi:tetratricopeptide (TPR) repeat protein
MEEEPQKLFEKGVALIKRGHPGDAMEYFERLIAMGYRSSACYSWLGLALARSGGDPSRAEELCKKAIEKEFYWPQYYLNLAEVYLLEDKKTWAIETLEKGLKLDPNNEAILKELGKLGIRGRPVIPFLSRSNPVNKYLGLLLSKLGLRG